jgi:hypothetical protein
MAWALTAALSPPFAAPNKKRAAARVTALGEKARASKSRAAKRMVIRVRRGLP